MRRVVEMAGGYKVMVKKNTDVKPGRGKKQPFHVVIFAGNGEALFWSENYANVTYANRLGEETAQALNAVLEIEPGARVDG